MGHASPRLAAPVSVRAFWNCYRPRMIRAKWRRLTVSNMRNGYGSNGNLMSYPDCTTTDDHFYYEAYVDWDITTNYGHFIASAELGTEY